MFEVNFVVGNKTDFILSQMNMTVNKNVHRGTVMIIEKNKRYELTLIYNCGIKYRKEKNETFLTER